MSTETIRILIAGALFVHGVGHTLGFWKPARSLLFLKVPKPTLRLVGGIIWVIVAIGFIASAMSFYGILLPADWWRPLAVVFAVISMVGPILFGRSWPVFNFIGASAMNIAVLVALLWLHWPRSICSTGSNERHGSGRQSNLHTRQHSASPSDGISGENL